MHAVVGLTFQLFSTCIVTLNNNRDFSWWVFFFPAVCPVTFVPSIPLKWNLIVVVNSAEYLHCGVEYRLLLSENTDFYMIRCIKCEEKDAYASTNLSSLFKKKKMQNLKAQPQTTTNKTNYLDVILEPKIVMHIPVSV